MSLRPGARSSDGRGEYQRRRGLARRNFLQDMACRRNPELYERFRYELAQDVQETIDEWLLLNDDVVNVTEPPK